MLSAGWMLKIETTIKGYICGPACTKMEEERLKLKSTKRKLVYDDNSTASEKYPRVVPCSPQPTGSASDRSAGIPAPSPKAKRRTRFARALPLKRRIYGSPRSAATIPETTKLRLLKKLQAKTGTPSRKDTGRLFSSLVPRLAEGLLYSVHSLDWELLVAS